MSDIAQDLGGVVLLPCPMCGGEAHLERQGHVACTTGWPCVHTAYFNSGTPAEQNAAAIAAWNTRTHSAEIAAALEQLRDLHDSIRTVYDAVPALPITADTMYAATDALHAFCLLVGIHRVDVGDPQPPPAMQASIDGTAGVEK